MESLKTTLGPLLAQFPSHAPTPRPDGCWCDGTGGAWPYVPLPVDANGERLGVIPGDDPPVGFRQPCICPEARAAQAAAAAYRERALRYWLDRRVAQKLARFWSDEAVPARYQHVSLEWFAASHPDPAWAGRVADGMRAWLDDGDRWLVLWGPPGHGKTALAVALLREFAMAERTVLFRSAPELLGRIKSTYSKSSAFSETDITDALVDVDALFLDDLGTEKASAAWLEATLFDLFNRRYNRLKRTIVTTNLDPRALWERIGDRSASRIREMAHGSIFKIDKIDLRAG